MNEFTYLIIRPIIDILIGDAIINDDMFEPFLLPGNWEWRSEHVTDQCQSECRVDIFMDIHIK